MRIRAPSPSVIPTGGGVPEGAEAMMATRFVDARGTEWEVWEVDARRLPADAAPPPTARWRDAASTGGWLRFESATQRRRLDRYPAQWQALDAESLSALCQAARLEPMGSARGALDLGDHLTYAW
ncbi:MAG: hypothetical protein JO180_12300 [Gemmatirosa sp.]|nr:hypothetical protein [Gemmatirosa sp.]